jgi:mRNA-degrading endonuclease RelE of RelBE toxin-antitoxin system
MEARISIKSTPAFDRKVYQLLSKEAWDEFLDYIEKNPEQGEVISGTGGVRKIRWKTGYNNKGKSSGVRILYHYSKDLLVLLIMIYAKSEKENVSQSDRNALRQMIPMLVEKYIGDE